MKHYSISQYIKKFVESDLPAISDFSRFYHNIFRDGENLHLKKIMITSAVSGEGKSTIASLFAVTLAKYRRSKILLIDLDFRKPKIHTHFNLHNNSGFYDALMRKKSTKVKYPDIAFIEAQDGETSIFKYIKPTIIDNLKVITSGRVPRSFTGFVDTSKIKDIFDELSKYFTVIIIDSPPVIPISEPVRLAREMDGIVILIRAGKTARELTKRSVDLLQNAGGKILGVVLNDLEKVLPYYYPNYKYYNERV